MNNSFHHRVDLFSLCRPCGVGVLTPNTLWLRYYDLVTERVEGGVNGVANVSDLSVIKSGGPPLFSFSYCKDIWTLKPSN